MAQSLPHVALFLFLIILANRLKHWGMFTAQEGRTLAKITVNITLPAAIAASFDTFTMDGSLLILILYGIGVNLVLVSLSYLFMHRTSNSLKAYGMLNGATYNVGNFSFPFVQALYGNSALVAASLFDLGNALMTTGFIYSLSSSVALGKRPSTKDLTKKLFTSVPFITYLVMIILSACNLHLPPFLNAWMQAIGKANPIIAMLMIGFMLEIRFERSWLKYSLLLLGLRHLVAILFAWYVLTKTNFNPVIKTTMALVVFSPISTISTAYTEQVSGEGRLASFTASLSVLLSIVSYTILSVLLA